MAFYSLTDKLQNVFRKLRSKGTITEADVKEAMKEVKRALLEADVNFKVVKQFINSVSERAVGEEVLKGLNPGQMVIKIVKEEMDKLMGSETTELKLLPSNEITIVMMCGLQGAGMSTMIQYVLYLAILVVLAIPLGAYIKNVMSGEKTFLSKVLTPCENLIYKVMRVDREEQMTWKKYAVSVMIFSGIGLVFLFLLQLLQGVLPGNPQNLSGVKWDLAFNTSASFITNTNWQAYSGESTLSYLTQALGLTVQNFVSAATGIAVLFALIRGFIKVKSSGLGSFWVDLTRIVVHILLPLNLVISLLLVGGGVIQNLKSAETVSLVEPIAVSAEGEILEDAVIDLDTETVTVDGEIVSNAQIVTEQFVPMGPAASQVAIKQTGTNGGGYMGVNSAHPLENKYDCIKNRRFN